MALPSLSWAAMTTGLLLMSDSDVSGSKSCALVRMSNGQKYGSNCGLSSVGR